MTQTSKFAVRATVAAFALIAGSSFAQVAIDANIELNNVYKSGNALTSDNKGISQNGRVEFNASKKAGADMFVAGKASFMAKKDGSAGIDDMWFQLGSKTADVKLGRFEAADLFPTDGDVALTNVDSNVGYRANLLRGRKGNDTFHAAGTVNFGAVSFELGLIDETKTTLTTDAGYKGVRPVVSFGAGPLTAKLGFESGEKADGTKGDGGALVLGYTAGGLKLGGSYASGKSAGVSARSILLTGSAAGFTLGYIDAKTDDATDSKENTIYLAYALPLMGVKGATVTPAFSTSTLKKTGSADQTVDAINVRLNYAF